MKESDFRLLESVLAAKTWQNSRIFSSIALKKLMNIRFTISKVSRNDQLKLSQSRNVSLTPELFPGNKSNTARLPLVFAKIFSIPPPYEQIPVIVGLVVFPRTATSQGENHHANWQLETVQPNKRRRYIYIERKRNWKSCSCQERRGERKARGARIRFETIMAGLYRSLRSLVIIVLRRLTMLATVKVASAALND